MTDAKYTVLPVSDPDEKVDPNLQPAQEQPHRGWCQRWRARCHRDGENNPARRRWKILKRILLTIFLFHLVGYAVRFWGWRFGWPRVFYEHSMQGLAEYSIEQYHPERTEPEFYSVDLADQDPVAQDLVDNFYYLFEWPNDDLGPFNRYDSLEDVVVPEDILELTEIDNAIIAGDRDTFIPEEDEDEESGEDEQGSGEDEQEPDDEEEEGRGHKHHKHHKHPKHPHHKPHPPPHPPHRGPPPKIECNDKDLTPWDGPSEFTFSPDEYNSVGLLLEGGVIPPAHVKVTQRSAEDTTEHVAIKLSVLLGDKHQKNKVTATAFDHNGAYVVEITAPKHRREGKPSTKDCIKIAVEIIFPAGLTTYGGLSLRLSSAVVKGHGLEGISFENVTAGVGHGALLFQQINAENVRLGAIRGIIRGHFDVSNNITVGTIRGFSHIHVNPTGEDIRVKASAVSGVASVQIPSDAYEGRFVLAALFGRLTVQAPDPADIHIEKLRHNYKIGYYKNKTDSIAILTTRHGVANLTFV